MNSEVLVHDADDIAAYVAARGAALQRFAYLMTGDSSESADLVQEALELAYPRWRSLVRKGTQEAYLKRSIANASVSRWRKLRRLVPVGDPAEYDDRRGADPGELTDAGEAWRLCGELPPTQRAAVVLRFYEDLSFAQIAAVLDCREATARSHVHRALKVLRGRLTAGGDDD